MRALAAVLLAALWAPGVTGAATDAATSGETQRWRIVQGQSAPWVATAVPVSADMLGHAVVFSRGSVDAPGALACSAARFESVTLPVEGLFQGNLPPPARDAALALGIVSTMLPTARVTCDGGSFDYHHASPQVMLVALDNVIWTLDRSPGAMADPASPEGVVQALLERHFAGDMGFAPASVEDKRDWLSASLASAVGAYFAQPAPEDEAPAINGDPFTNAQEYPQRFSVQAARVEGEHAFVPVRFTLWDEVRSVRYDLVREDGAWRVDELTFDSGGSLRQWLDDAAMP